MKPWREIAVPHADVLEGTFQQSEFTADITLLTAKKEITILMSSTQPRRGRREE